MTAKAETKTNQITEGVIWKQLLIFFFPILFGTFFQQLYNTADAMIVGHFVGKQALAAVGGTTGTIINLLIGFFVGLASGATVIIAQYYGGRQEQKVHWAVHTSVAFSILAGVFLMIVGILLSRPLLALMNTPDDVMDYAVLYIRIYFSGTIANLVYNMGAGILRAIGDSRRPLYFLIASCFLNIALDFLFVAVFGAGVAGAGIATILSQLLSAVLVLSALMRSRDMYRLELKKLHIDTRMLRRIIRIGFPAGMESVLYSLSNIIVQSGVNGLGTDSVAAWAAYGKVDGLFWMMISALGISATTFIGQNYGAKRMDRVHKGVRVCMGIAIIMTLIMDVVLLLGGDFLLRMFTSDAAVREIGHQLLRFMVPTFVAYVAIEIFSGALRGVGDCWIPMIIAGVGICGVRVLWIWFGLPNFPTIIGAAFCYPLTWVISTIAFIIYYCFFSKLSKRNKEYLR